MALTALVSIVFLTCLITIGCSFSSPHSSPLSLKSWRIRGTSGDGGGGEIPETSPFSVGLAAVLQNSCLDLEFRENETIADTLMETKGGFQDVGQIWLIQDVPAGLRREDDGVGHPESREG